MTSLFSKPQPTVVNMPAAPAPLPQPTVTPPAVMPVQNSPSAIAAAQRAQADVLKRAGRTSTILTAPNQRGNSRQNYDSYSSARTGAA